MWVRARVRVRVRVRASANVRVRARVGVMIRPTRTSARLVGIVAGKSSEEG